MSEALLVLWLAGLGVDRLDLLGGAGPFLLTPFLLLTPLVAAAEGARVIGHGGRLVFRPGSGRYSSALLVFLVVTAISVVFAIDPLLGLRRYSLLLAQAFGTAAVVVFIAMRPDPRAVLAKGAYAGIVVGALFCAAQIWLFLQGDAASEGAARGVLFLEPFTYGGFVPRLSGGSVDVNRGPLVFIIYLFLLLQFARASRWRTLAATVAIVCIFASLSRSAMLALLLLCVWVLLRRGRLSLSPRLAYRLALAGVAVVMAGFVFQGALVAASDTIGRVLQLRLLGDESAGIHAALFARAFEVGTASLHNAMLGIGFGNSNEVLQEFFPGDKYGNFHSLYLTLWVESGVVALGIGLLLLVYPFVRSDRYRPLVAALIGFNLFYQSTLEPTFWFVLALAWMGVAERRRETVAREPRTRAMPRPTAAAAALALVLLGGCSDLLREPYEYGEVVVSVTRRDGEPIAGTELILYTGRRPMEYGETGPDGRVVFDFVPIGQYGVEIRPPDGFELPAGARTNVDAIQVDEGARETLDFTLLKVGPGDIHVRVLDDAGDPLSDLQLWLYTSEGPVAEGRTDASGEHAFLDVPFGDYGVRVDPRLGLLPVRAHADGIVIEEGVDERITLELERCMADVRVATRAGGTGVPESEVFLYTYQGVQAQGVTDEAGVHTFEDVGCGPSYGVRVTPPAGYVLGSGPGYVDAIEITNGETVAVEFELWVCTGTAVAEVFDDTDAAVEGAAVALYDTRQVVARGETDASGRVRFPEVGCGEYGFKIEALPDGYSATGGRGSSFIDGLRVEEGEVVTGRVVVERS